MPHQDASLHFCHLPSEVLASVLCGFSQGKAISTFLMVALGNQTLRPAAWTLCRGALVQRYVELRAHFAAATLYTAPNESNDDEHDNTTRLATLETTRAEICDVLDMVREDVRLSNDSDVALVTSFSKWCAILDYFETHVAVTNAVGHCIPQWMVWCGQFDVAYGTTDACLVTPDWTVGSMHYWRAMELDNLRLTHPRSAEFHVTTDRIPYGTVLGVGATGRRLLGIQSSDLQVSVLRDTIEARRHSLVPHNEEYDENPTTVFCDHSFVSRIHQTSLPPIGPLLIAPGRESLCCCWDKELGEDDWDEAMSRLGEHVIRVMTLFAAPSTHTTFADALRERYQTLNEFGNHR